MKLDKDSKMNMISTFVVIMYTIPGAVGDSRCRAIGGNCQYDLSSCPGGVRSGLCNGPRARRCCLPAPSTGGPCLTSSEMTALENKLITYEAIRLTAYDAQPQSSYEDLTICVGFNLKRDGARTVFRSVLPGVDFDSVYNRRASLTRDQCMALFRHDLTQTYIPRAKRVAGNQFCGFPENVKIAIVNAVYRGDLAYNHRTAGYIRAGNWCAVADEYLDNYQYRNCRQLGIPGVCTRMDWNAAQFRTMC
ncbi:uncharacterized protein LOC135477195 isoform X1 [Liolophura sinensis]|uniref:uncharacterized protein LOC135477195 isoform X1 n=1 Tax=Liolophura sinensis TaxID=3198878 RepID=UPI00315988A4